jgi:hypothetical protein
LGVHVGKGSHGKVFMVSKPGVQIQMVAKQFLDNRLIFEEW